MDTKDTKDTKDTMQPWQASFARANLTHATINLRQASPPPRTLPTQPSCLLPA